MSVSHLIKHVVVARRSRQEGRLAGRLDSPSYNSVARDGGGRGRERGGGGRGGTGLIGKDGGKAAREVGRKNCRPLSINCIGIEERSEQNSGFSVSTPLSATFMFGGSSVLPWICSLGTGLLVRSLIIRLSFVPSFCDQSHSGTNEREQAASPRWSGWLVGSGDIRVRGRPSIRRCPCRVVVVVVVRPVV